jgi:hypothetical protein
MAGKFKAALKQIAADDYSLSQANREFLDRMMNDFRMEKVLDRILTKRPKIWDSSSTVSLITFVIKMLLFSRDNAEEINTIEARTRKDKARAFWLARADAAKSLAQFWMWELANFEREQDPPLIDKFGAVEAYRGRKISESEIDQRWVLYSEDARLLRDQAERISKPASNRISRTRRGPKGHTRERMSFALQMSDRMRLLCGVPLDYQVAVLTELAFPGPEISAEQVRSWRQPPARGRHRSARPQN